MRESAEEMAEIQRMLDAHMARANPHMRAIVTPKNRLTAEQLVRYLEGVKHVAFASVNAKGEPRVSPLDALFIHGRFVMSTGAEATKVAQLRANPACSAVHVDGDRIAVAVNGTVEWLEPDHPDHAEILDAWIAQYGSDPYTWGTGIVFFRIQPTSMWAYAQRPKDFPE